MSALISVQLDAVQELAAELAALATGLADETPPCASAAVSLTTALAGGTGEWAGGAARGWAGLVAALSDGAGTTAATLSSAVESYRRTDALLSQRVGSGRRGRAVIA